MELERAEHELDRDWGWDNVIWQVCLRCPHASLNLFEASAAPEMALQPIYHWFSQVSQSPVPVLVELNERVSELLWMKAIKA